VIGSSRLRIVALLVVAVVPALALFAWLQAQVNVTPSPPALGSPAPPVNLALLYGGDASLDRQRGNVVVMNLWATWCAACRTEMPSLQRVADDLGTERFTLFEVNLGEDAAAIDPFRQQLGLRTPVLLDVQGDVAQRYGVGTLPATFVIDQQGDLRLEHLGPLVEGDASTAWSAPWVEQQARALLESG
jgi:thiol-disulfide isomerase/thioredoxin